MKADTSHDSRDSRCPLPGPPVPPEPPQSCLAWQGRPQAIGLLRSGLRYRSDSCFGDKGGSLGGAGGSTAILSTKTGCLAVGLLGFQTGQLLGRWPQCHPLHLSLAWRTQETLGLRCRSPVTTPPLR